MKKTILILFSFENLNSFIYSNWKSCCDDLDIGPNNENFCELDGQELFQDVYILQILLLQEINITLDMLTYFKRLDSFLITFII